ncbi:D-aminoacyl-tRNA deacylase [Fusibacter bizertensis]|uniref:D-aminoacyl-tRNA deacylase n=1 Tax=Fusibacter bizertensis TaxID=1488331 RepID=A0ABT6N9N7_9FIRM|nr:D-aminoacyl-tRNA deacylase [Fusibacter bizertensis]MDH8677132.1 D-aminoacyl-tRNA deacylase [Fusibacter bizertensis]
MRAVIQRVNFSSVEVEGKIVGKINKGINVLLGVEDGDSIQDVKYMAEKIVNLRIFEDADEKMNLSLLDVSGEMLCISQFTLLGDCRKGRRPSFVSAAKPDEANELYKQFCEAVKEMGIHVETGIFQADMKVDIQNDGPVTVLVDSKKQF